jgi:hypothetical protein
MAMMLVMAGGMAEGPSRTWFASRGVIRIPSGSFIHTRITSGGLIHTRIPSGGNATIITGGTKPSIDVDARFRFERGSTA